MLKDLDEMEAMIHAAIAYARGDGGGESPVAVDIVTSSLSSRRLAWSLPRQATECACKGHRTPCARADDSRSSGDSGTWSRMQ
jgi:hypothetical protein